jgi:hypothetical protein
MPTKKKSSKKKIKTAGAAKEKKPNRYAALIEKIFFAHYQNDGEPFEFQRSEVETTAAELEIELPKNIGDAIYSFRYRYELPRGILETAASGYEWLIFPAGRSRYRFKQFKASRIVPRSNYDVTKIPDATPTLILENALSDEQALLAKIRYNRLVDIFLGISTYSLQNHMRTTVKSLGGSQIEIDEMYAGIDTHGTQYIIPVQAKVGNDKLGVVQLFQDIECCKEKFPNLICRAVAAQFMQEGKKIALFELRLGETELLVRQEKHYELAALNEISATELLNYRELSGYPAPVTDLPEPD